MISYLELKLIKLRKCLKYLGKAFYTQWLVPDIRNGPNPQDDPSPEIFFEWKVLKSAILETIFHPVGWGTL